MAYYAITFGDEEAKDNALVEFARFTLRVATTGRKVELDIEAFKNKIPESAAKVTVFIVEAHSSRDEAAKLFLKTVEQLFKKKKKAVPKVAFRPIKCLNVPTGKFLARVSSPKFWPGKRFVNSANYISVEKACISCGSDKHSAWDCVEKGSKIVLTLGNDLVL